MKELIDTGERILLEKETPLMIARHLCAYKFAKDYVLGKEVLDIGCGEGYGSFYLSGFAARVTGIDYDEAIIDYAKNKYQKENLRFFVTDAENLNYLKGKFQAACSFQFIEHIQDAHSLLININNLLEDGGIFICSTPNIKDASGESGTPLNRFHAKEYLYPEFKQLLEAHFKRVDLFALKRGGRLKFYIRLKKIGLFNFLPDKINPVKRFYNNINCGKFLLEKDNFDAGLDFIAVCSK